MCGLTTEQTHDGQLVAQLVLRPFERLAVWAIIGLASLTLITAGAAGINSVIRISHSDKISQHDTALLTIVESLATVTAELKSLNEWKGGVNVNDRYTSHNAEADRLINTTERGKLATAIENLRARMDKHAQDFADHRAESAHTGATARMAATEQRMALLEALMRQPDTN